MSGDGDLGEVDDGVVGVERLDGRAPAGRLSFAEDFLQVAVQ